MNVLGISVIGWALIGLVYVPASIVLLIFAFGRWRSRPGKAAVVAVLVYAPLVAAVAEGMYVDAQFKALCATSGTQVARSVIVEGLYDNGFRKDRWEDSLKSQQEGYRLPSGRTRMALYGEASASVQERFAALKSINRQRATTGIARTSHPHTGT